MQRYLIVNGVSTAIMYAAIWAFAPNPVVMADKLREGIEVFAFDNALLGPLFHRIVTVTGLI